MAGWTGGGDHVGGFNFSPYPKQFVQPRQEPMEVMCLGLPRTGTMSVCIALNKLGIRTYDMTECAKDHANGSTRRWLDGVEANYLNGYGRKLKNKRDFDDLTYRYQAVSSMPAVLFSDQLVEAYPNAKVILTESDPDTFVKSMQKSYYNIINDRSTGFIAMFDSDYKKNLIPLLRCALRVWTKNDENNMEALKEGYTRHNKHIREIVDKKRLLVFDPKNGWEPLCDFLDLDVPKEPFPLVDEDQLATGIHKNVFKRFKTMEGLQMLVRNLIVLALVVYGLYWLLKTD